MMRGWLAVTSRRRARASAARSARAVRVDAAPLVRRGGVARLCWMCGTDVAGVFGRWGHQVQLCDGCRAEFVSKRAV
jgi:hypothetical protein